MVSVSMKSSNPMMGSEPVFMFKVSDEEKAVEKIKTGISKMGEKSINWEIEFSREGTRLALGKASTVCCIWSNKGLKSIPIPPEIRLKLYPA